MKLQFNFATLSNSVFITLLALLWLPFVNACSDDDDDGNGDATAIQMIAIPAGSFVMGDATGTYEDNEQPSRSVTLNAFMISKTEITQKQYKDVVGGNPSKSVGDNKPVESLTWIEAVEFCNALSAKEGRQACYSGIPNSVTCDFNANGYRLPTEAEWEYACRAGTTTVYHSGNTLADLTRCSWNSGNANGSTNDCGKLEANAWGLHDMHGNVFEWCWDWYKKDYYALGENNNPKGPTSGAERVCRGGSWFVYQYGHRASFRSMLSPAFRGIDIGFRIVRKQG